MNETTTTGGVEQKPYLYEETIPDGILRDLAGFGAGPAPGEKLPDFDLLTTDGKRVRREDFLGARPLLITFASLSCPMTAASAPPLKRLYETHGEGVAFLSVYVREAMPGDRIPQARDRDEKLTFAHRYRQRDGIPWPVAVDSLDGDFHQPMGGHPNACYIVDENGVVAFRALWSSDEAAIDAALRRVREGKAVEVAESTAKAAALLGGVGMMSEVLEEAGPRAQSAALRASPAVYGVGKLAGVFTPLPPVGRAVAALSLIGGTLAALLKVVAGSGRRRRQRP
jgi:hypothetical protein